MWWFQVDNSGLGASTGAQGLKCQTGHANMQTSKPPVSAMVATNAARSARNSRIRVTERPVTQGGDAFPHRPFKIIAAPALIDASGHHGVMTIKIKNDGGHFTPLVSELAGEKSGAADSVAVISSVKTL